MFWTLGQEIPTRCFEIQLDTQRIAHLPLTEKHICVLWNIHLSYTSRYEWIQQCFIKNSRLCASTLLKTLELNMMEIVWQPYSQEKDGK